MILKLSLLVFLALYLVARIGLRGQSQRWAVWLDRLGMGAAVLAVLSSIAFGQFVRGSFINDHDVYHYYFGAKYSADHQYLHLYECTFQALDTARPSAVRRVKSIRSLETYRFVKVETLRASPLDCEQLFGPERWAQFTRDLVVFDQAFTADWRTRLRDKGYNATPLWDSIGGAIARQIPAGKSMLALACFDYGLLLLAFIVVFQAFGAKGLVISLLILGGGYELAAPHIRSGFLRLDWLAALFGVVGFIRLERPGWAGALLAYAAAIRVFPALFVLGPVISIGIALVKRRKLQAPSRTFVLSFTLVSVGLLGLTLAEPGGVDRFSNFVEKISIHRKDVAPLRVGLGAALIYEGERSSDDFRGLRGQLGYRPHFVSRKQDKRRRIAPLKYGLAALFIAALGLFLWRRREGEPSELLLESFLCGFPLVYLLLNPTFYYYCFLAPFVLGFAMSRRARLLSLGVPLLVLAFELGSFAVGATEPFSYRKHFAISMSFGVVVVLFVAGLIWLTRSQTDAPSDASRRAWPWSARLAVVGGALALVDAVLGEQLGTYPGAVGAALGLGLTFGAVIGAVLDLVGLGLAHLPRRAAFVIWPGLGLLTGTLLGTLLGTLFASLLAVTGGLLLAVLQPTRTDPHGLAARLTAAHQHLVAGALVILSAGSLVLDQLLFAGLYPAAHTAARLTTLVALGAALSFHRSWRPSKRRAGLLAFALTAVTLGTFASLHRAPSTSAAVMSRPYPGCWLSSLRALTDFDGDGASGFLAGGDIAPWDAGTTFIPGGDHAPDPTLADVSVYSAPKPAPLSVIFITIDTLRPDRLGAYGHSRDTSPNIDALAIRSTRFTRAYTAGTKTSLALAAAFRGVYPRRLHWTQLVETSSRRVLRSGALDALRVGETRGRWFGLVTADPRPTLAQRLRARGMKTMAVVDGGASAVFNPQLGAAEGFDTYHLVPTLGMRWPHNAGTTALALVALDEASPSAPFFMWVHYFGPHGPNAQIPGVRTYGPSQPDRYDHMLHHTDRELGRLLDKIERLQAERPVLIVLAGDHGESFGKTRYHGNAITEGQVRIPLLISGPGFEAGVDERLTSIVDIMPTLLAATDTPIGGAIFDGMNLAMPAPKMRTVLAQTWRYRADLSADYDLLAVMDGRRVLTLDRVTNHRKTTRQGKQGLKRSRGRKTPAALSEALNAFLRQTGGGAVDWR